MTTPPESPQFINPFAQPGSDGQGDIPLNPLDEPLHVDQYVDVDNTHRAFAEFCEKLADDPSRLRRAGWFVAVSGPTGCGKTSLIYRCAHYLRSRLESNFVTRVHDLSTETHSTESMEKRIARVCGLLATKIKPDLSPQDAEELRTRSSAPGDLLPFLSDVLKDDLVIILILPSTELLQEIERWWDATRTKFVIFAEWRAMGIPGTAAPAIPAGTPQTRRLLPLQVGPLEDGNGRAFATARTSGDDAGKFPELDPEAAEQLIGIRSSSVGTSIRQVQKMLYGLYEEYRRQPEPPHGIVRVEDLAHYIAKWAESFNERQ